MISVRPLVVVQLRSENLLGIKNQSRMQKDTSDPKCYKTTQLLGAEEPFPLPPPFFSFLSHLFFLSGKRGET